MCQRLNLDETTTSLLQAAPEFCPDCRALPQNLRLSPPHYDDARRASVFSAQHVLPNGLAVDISLAREEITVQVPVVTGLYIKAGRGLTFRGFLSRHINETAGNSDLGQGKIMTESGHRLLLVESDPLLAEVTAYRLQLLGYRVEVAGTTTELWAGVDSLRPHALLINLDMDDLRPMELLERLTSDSTTAEIPLFAFSAQSDLDQVERVWKHGVRDYLVTPYDPIILERKIAKLLADVPLTSESEYVRESEATSDDPKSADPNTDEVSTAELVSAGA